MSEATRPGDETVKTLDRIFNNIELRLRLIQERG